MAGTATPEQLTHLNLLFQAAHPAAPPLPAATLESLSADAADELAESLAAVIADGESRAAAVTVADVEAARALLRSVTRQVTEAARQTMEERDIPFTAAADIVINALIHTMATERPGLYAAYRRAQRLVNTGPR